MSIKRGFVAGSDGQIKQAWCLDADGTPSPYPDNLTLAPGDVVYEDTASSEEDWQAFSRSLSDYVIIGGQRVPKIPMPVSLSPQSIKANGKAIATISGIPADTQAQFRGQAVIVNDGLLEISIDLPGDYAVSLSHPLYLPAQVIIHAT